MPIKPVLGLKTLSLFKEPVLPNVKNEGLGSPVPDPPPPDHDAITSLAILPIYVKHRANTGIFEES